MPRLSPAVPAGFFLVDGQPCQRGTVKVTYTANTISMQDHWGGIWKDIPFSTITNGSTEATFSSMEELKTFVDDNFFQP